MSFGQAFAAGLKQYDTSLVNPTFKQKRERRKLAQEKHVAEAGITATDNERKALEAQDKLSDHDYARGKAVDQREYDDEKTARGRLADTFIEDMATGDFRRTVERWNKAHAPEKHLENLTVDGQGNVVGDGVDGKTYTYPMPDVANYLGIEVAEENGIPKLVKSGYQDKDLERREKEAKIQETLGKNEELKHLTNGDTVIVNTVTNKTRRVNTGGVGLLGAQKGIADVGQTLAETNYKNEQARSEQVNRANTGISIQTGKDGVLYTLNSITGRADPVLNQDGTPLQGKEQVNEFKQKIETLNGYGLPIEKALQVATGFSKEVLQGILSVAPHLQPDALNNLVEEMESISAATFNLQQGQGQGGEASNPPDYTSAAEVQKDIASGKLLVGTVIRLNGNLIKIASP